MVKHWMKTCMETHGPKCPSKKAILPSRLIDVGCAGHPTVSLHVANGETGQWLTLSHCWGKKALSGTTTTNFEARCNSIHLFSLPQTFQDAISIARKLGYRFIWIDCLCIIQDSLEDWHAESARMAEMYAGADMNISADTAADAYEGIFRSSNKLPNNPDLVAHSRYEEFEEIPVHGSLLPGPTKLFASRRDSQYDPDVLSLLGKRAWVFQEALLSRRRLRYTVQGLVWHCRTVHSLCTERNPHKIHDVDFDKGYVVSVYDIPYEPLPPRWAFGSIPRLGFQAIFWWYRQVNEYAPLLLTFPKDRFPALSGLAKEFSSRTGYEYQCGIWKEDFRRGLLWESTGGATDLTIAPSWSWAAAKCYANYKPIYACRTEEWDYLEGREAELIECGEDSTRVDVFGQAVLPVMIRLRGLCKSFKSLLESSIFYFGTAGDPLGRRDAAYEPSLDEPASSSIRICMDDEDMSIKAFWMRKEPMVIQIARFKLHESLYLESKWTRTSKESSFGLVLERTSDYEAIYRRIGIVEMPEDGSEEFGWEMKTVTIV